MSIKRSVHSNDTNLLACDQCHGCDVLLGVRPGKERKCLVVEEELACARLGPMASNHATETVDLTKLTKHIFVVVTIIGHGSVIKHIRRSVKSNKK